MQRLEVSGAVRLIYKSLGVKGLKTHFICRKGHSVFPLGRPVGGQGTGK